MQKLLSIIESNKVVVNRCFMKFTQVCGNIPHRERDMITPGQLRAARALLGWSASDLAKRAGVHETTVQRMEHRDGQTRGTVATLEKVMNAFEAESIEFLNEHNCQGVRLRQQ